MRIALVSNLFPPIQTGSSYWAAELCENLARCGDEVVVITCGKSKNVEVVHDRGVTVYRLPTVLRLPRAEIFLHFDQFYTMWSRRNLDAMVSILRDHRIEIVHQCGQLLDSILLTKKSCRNLGLPSVCSIHSRIYHPGNRLYDWLFWIADRHIVRTLAMDEFGILVALDKTIASYAEEIYQPRRIEIVPVCVSDTMLERASAQPGDGRQARILSVGHVTDMRNRSELLAAVATLLNEGMELRLAVAGKLLTSVTAAEVERLGIRESVDLCGEIERETVMSMLADSHVEAHWLTYPGVGSASMEAMALGLPVLVRAFEGIYGDVPLKHMQNVVLVDPDKPESIVNPLRELVRDPNLRRSIGQNARELIREHLSWSVTIEKFRSLYRQAMA